MYFDYGERRSMMRSDSEVAAEALNRAFIMKSRQKQRREWLSATVILSACLSLAICLTTVQRGYSGVNPAVEAMAQAPLMFPDAGGYVLTGVIAFCAGVAATLFWGRNRTRDETGKSETVKQKEKDK